MASKKHVRSGAPVACARSSSTTTTAATHCLSMAGKTFDNIAELSHVFKGYVALERFVSPEYADEAQALVPPTRAELGSLLHSLNAQVQRQMDKLTDNITVLQAQMLVDSAAPPPAP